VACVKFTAQDVNILTAGISLYGVMKHLEGDGRCILHVLIRAFTWNTNTVVRSDHQCSGFPVR